MSTILVSFVTFILIIGVYVCYVESHGNSDNSVINPEKEAKQIKKWFELIYGQSFFSSYGDYYGSPKSGHKIMGQFKGNTSIIYLQNAYRNGSAIIVARIKGVYNKDYKEMVSLGHGIINDIAYFDDALPITTVKSTPTRAAIQLTINNMPFRIEVNVGKRH
jgi:hypothetical protein